VQDKAKTSILEIRDLGIINYTEALALQKQLVTKRIAGSIPNTALILEHPAVITLGARKSENKLLAGIDDLKNRNIEVVPIRRGGGSTAHNPGQVILYPIIALKSVGLGVNEFVRTLEAIGIDLLAALGIEAARRKGYPGLWTAGRKIGSIGVKIQKWVSFHGMAINICNDLGIFDNIVPCGIDDVEMTSVAKEMNKEISMTEVKDKLAQLCVKSFSGKDSMK
jgi:lipoate-protein ligase B